jgi:hypothetical protein
MIGVAGGSQLKNVLILKLLKGICMVNEITKMYLMKLLKPGSIAICTSLVISIFLFHFVITNLSSLIVGLELLIEYEILV